MIRVTLEDPQETISFLASEAIARRLVAGCSANPGTVGELLLATEVFRQGIAVDVMASLMEFDKALLRGERLPPAPDAAEPESNSSEVHSAFQVVDAQTEAQALSPTREGLVIIDLEARTISANSSLQIQASGELLAYSGNVLTDRAITYVLPKEWSLRAL